MQIEEMRLDGNAAAGTLREIFTREMTTAMATCSGCRKTTPMGTLMNYGGDMGVILRCPTCNTVMLRIVTTPGWVHMDASGTSMVMIHDATT